MVKLYASHSSDYFAIREPGRLHLYKDSSPQLCHRIHDKMAGELVLLSDAGECFFRSADGLFRLRREKNVRAERCRAVKDIDGSPERGTLKGIAVRADGEQIAYEQVLPAQKFTSKLKRFLGQRSAQGDVGPRLHRFIVSQWSGRGGVCYYETVVDPRTSVGLVWWVSADFGYLAVMDRDRSGRSQLRLIDILDESVVNELEVEGRVSRDRYLTTNGSVGFGLEKEGKRAFIVWTYNQERFGIPYPKDSRVIHLGKDIVVFMSRQHELITAKTYAGKTVVEVSLKPLTALGIRYLLSFNQRGSLELVTYGDGRLRVHHTDLESLPIDARRWELLGERRRAQQLESTADRIIDEETADRTRQDHQLQQADLASDLEEHLIASAQNSAETPAPPPVDVVEALPMQATPVPPSPVQASPAPHYIPHSPSEPAPLSGSPFSFSTQEEVEGALERLRMRYIAGELTREDYYNEKSIIEKAASRLPQSTQPQTPVFPRTLDFTTE